MKDDRMTRIEELLADRATQGLSEVEHAELERLLAESPGADPEAFDLAAAAADLALGDEAPQQALPGHLRERLLARAEAFAGASTSAPETPPRPHAPGGDVARLGERRAASRSSWIGWVAAAAAAVIAIVGWTRQPEAPVIPPEPDPPSAVEAREALVETAPDLVRVAWSEGGDEAGEGISGDVVWSDELQQGYMRFVGLDPNDPRQEQYQLWIFDAERTEKHPVDGGVFDVPRSGKVVVPIRPKLPVSEATLFAVTVEQPGGVVVSTRERVATVAQVPGEG